MSHEELSSRRKAIIKNDLADRPTMEDLELTDQELRIAQMVVLGKSKKQIAKELGLSEDTVRNHTSAAREKVGEPHSRWSILHFFRNSPETSPDGAQIDFGALSPTDLETVQAYVDALPDVSIETVSKALNVTPRTIKNRGTRLSNKTGQSMVAIVWSFITRNRT